MLTLGAGGDNQSHVTRPRTAKTTQNSNKKRADSKLETITERNPAEEEAIAGVSQAALQSQLGTFDIEASHSFSMRNFGKYEKSSAAIVAYNDIEGGAGGGKESSLSNYSRIQAESINARS